jgi:predicted alpha/beta hydrolase family esterase
MGSGDGDMTAMQKIKVLTLPGWLNSGRGDWIARLEEVVLQQPAPVLLAAHSLGCHLVAAWAAHSRQIQRVRGALLVAPPDVRQPDLPPQLHRWAEPVLQPLPFKAVLVASHTDPFASFEMSSRLAQAWGASLADLGARGHINAESGLGDWPQGRAWLMGLCGSLSPFTES